MKYLQKAISLDLRSLALFRILTGLFLLGDALTRLSSVEALYTDAGLLPRPTLMMHAWEPWFYYFSLHTRSGEADFQIALLLLQALFALMILLGLFTRFVIPLMWYLLVSLLVRNPLAVNGGDMMMLNILLWGLFLPLGSRYSLDKKFNTLSFRLFDFRNESTGVAGLAAFAFMLQLVFIYFGSALEKSGLTWHNGTALTFALHHDFYQKPFAEFLLGFPLLCKGLSYFALWLEKYFIFLIFLPWKNRWFRGVVVLMYIAFHGGIFLCLEIGMFSLFAIAAWAALLPGEWWDKLFPKSKNEGENKPETTKTSQTLKFAAYPVLAFLLSVSALSLLNRHELVKLPDLLKTPADVLHLEQAWGMFAPNGPKNAGWLILETELENGSKIDLFSGKAVSEEKPERFSASFPNHRIRKYTKALLKGDRENFAEDYARFQLKKYEAKSNLKVKSIGLRYMRVRIWPSLKRSEAKPKEIWKFTRNELLAGK